MPDDVWVGYLEGRKDVVTIDQINDARQRSRQVALSQTGNARSRVGRGIRSGEEKCTARVLGGGNMDKRFAGKVKS